MAHFVMQNLERSFAKLETQTYKETCVFPQFNYVRKTLKQLNYILMEGPYIADCLKFTLHQQP